MCARVLLSSSSSSSSILRCIGTVPASLSASVCPSPAVVLSSRPSIDYTNLPPPPPPLPSSSSVLLLPSRTPAVSRDYGVSLPPSSSDALVASIRQLAARGRVSSPSWRHLPDASRDRLLLLFISSSVFLPGGEKH